MITPLVATLLNVVLLLLNGIANGTLLATGTVDPATAVKIAAAAGTAQSVLNVMLHAFSAPAAGPLVKKG